MHVTKKVFFFIPQRQQKKAGVFIMRNRNQAIIIKLLEKGGQKKILQR